MAETEVNKDEEGFDVGEFLQKNINKGELALKRAVGLGAQPNVVPEGEPIHDGEPRPVEIGWHPVGGLAGNWFANSTGLGKMITERINKYPDPTQHWAVLVGEYVHQLWMDENFHVIYINGRINREEWKTFSVGQTRFNDDALRRAGETVISTIREKTPAYNLISNNCQTYALQLLDAIKIGARKEFGTTLAVYDRLFGPGKVADLFNKDGLMLSHGTDSGVAPATEAEDENTVGLAQQLMNDHTAQLDAQEQLNKSGELTPPQEAAEAQSQSRDLGSGSVGGNENGEKKESKSAEVKKQIKNIFNRFSRNKSS
ncbi:hypothetical protein ISF_09322 [Cordyceps fumosorosea ARSEF 2679]|uniref:DUF862-domain-containing protein n=1 Tax=Cordyceps fumosorosea (strain ARSEF 2679) TaxID=1081104 RepID=A0A162K1Q2_CORFA|nr:hypothetical protein ISF_09322 [Cordyceps fumosorosea ARSEF 2679]OAA52158.1 hypothetical protein ISF_09322 [Cordyceps fumosorosea ARSEF 2679]